MRRSRVRTHPTAARGHVARVATVFAISMKYSSHPGRMRDTFRRTDDDVRHDVGRAERDGREFTLRNIRSLVSLRPRSSRAAERRRRRRSSSGTSGDVEARRQFGDATPQPFLFRLGGDVPERLDDDLSDLAYLIDPEAARGYRRGSEPDTARDRGFLRIERDRVLINGDADFVEVGFHRFPGEVFRSQIDEQEMRVRPARDQPNPAALQLLAEDLGVGDDSFL